ncbi:glycoprotein-N-acetylgalactosamine 3-beta-galactosyltransferase 1-like [Convolutriloba macropyga]|uniref:glycoprotein-N-acetylgalactosamine 3-beta-galactosyltransferase 1-like n=1 Tax=Convolutriloba macropyga TaxID=536237 RepID=UPI003F52755C
MSKNLGFILYQRVVKLCLLSVLLYFGCRAILTNISGVMSNVFSVNLPKNEYILSSGQAMNPRFSEMSLQLFCFVPTYEKMLSTRAVAVRDTWGRRCDRMIFAADEDNKTFPTLKMGEPGRKMLWAKVRDTFEFLFDNYLEKYDWFYKGDDNTYVIVENMKLHLSKYDPDRPWFFGHRFKAFLKEGYVSGGPGYVLSRGALRLLGPKLKMNNYTTTGCMPGHQNGGPFRGEDFRMGECLASLGIAPSRTLDEKGRELFHVFNLEGVLSDVKGLTWYHFFNYYPHKGKFECCSERSVSFHYVSPQQIYAIEYLLYHVNPVVHNLPM